MAKKALKKQGKLTKSVSKQTVSEKLKEKLKAEVESDTELYLRLHRAISWLKSAEKTDTLDYRFMSLWIGFNSLYASDLTDLEGVRCSEGSNIYRFFNKMYEHDNEGKIDKMLWKRFSQEIHVLIRNQYVFKAFWDSVAGEDRSWEKELKNSINRCKQHLAKANTVKLLGEIFTRLYVLRNQVFHGHATFQSIVNRDQVRDATAIMHHLLPVFIQIMIANREVDWGAVKYPVINHPNFQAADSKAS